jgi:hypothetical protein
MSSYCHFLACLLLDGDHFPPNLTLQTYWRTQSHAAHSTNIVNEIAEFLESIIDLGINSATIEVTIQAFETLIEMSQGPCRENQELLVHSNLPGRCMFILEHNDYPGE